MFKQIQKNKGGLEITTSLYKGNVALLSKCLCSRIITGKYGEDLVKILFIGREEVKISGTSEFIRDLERIPHEYGENISVNNRFKWEINNGRSTKFWTDWWNESSLA